MSPTLIIPEDIHRRISTLARCDSWLGVASTLAGVCVREGSNFALIALVEPRQIKNFYKPAACPNSAFLEALTELYENRPELYDSEQQTVLFRARTRGNLSGNLEWSESESYSELVAAHQTDLLHCIFGPEEFINTWFPRNQRPACRLSHQAPNPLRRLLGYMACHF